MAKVLANGQITIVDLNDGKAVQCFTQCSKGETQIYTPDTGVYTPNYSASEPNVITARVYVTGNASDQAPTSACTGWSWKVDGVAATPVSGKSYQLNLASNIDKNGNVKNIEWSCKYTDPETKATTTCIGYKTISLAKSGGALQTVQQHEEAACRGEVLPWQRAGHHHDINDLGGAEYQCRNMGRRGFGQREHFGRREHSERERQRRA